MFLRFSTFNMANSRDTNTPCCINILPTELLCDIFVLGYLTIGLQKLSIHYRITISSVSKRWYSLVLEEPRLWSEITISVRNEYDKVRWDAMPEMSKSDQAILRLATLCFSRSKSAPLQLSILLFWVHEELQHQVKRLVLPHLHRCRSLRLKFFHREFFTHPVDPLKIWFPLPDIPSLNHLNIFLSLESLYDGKIIHLGPPLTLRTFELKVSRSRPIFHSNFTVT